MLILTSILYILLNFSDHGFPRKNIRGLSADNSVTSKAHEKFNRAVCKGEGGLVVRES